MAAWNVEQGVCLAGGAVELLDCGAVDLCGSGSVEMRECEIALLCDYELWDCRTVWLAGCGTVEV